MHFDVVRCSVLPVDVCGISAVVVLSFILRAELIVSWSQARRQSRV